VLRRELEAGSPWLTVPVGLLGLFALVWGFTADIRLALGLIGGMGVLMALLALLASVLLRLGSRLKGPMPCAWPSITSPERGSGLFQLAGFRPGADAVRAAVGGAGRSAGGFFHPVACRCPEPLLVNVADSEREGILADLHRPGPSPRTSTPWCAGA
jgi:putative ABC transport system permease protein